MFGSGFGGTGFVGFGGLTRRRASCIGTGIDDACLSSDVERFGGGATISATELDFGILLFFSIFIHPIKTKLSSSVSRFNLRFDRSECDMLLFTYGKSSDSSIYLQTEREGSRGRFGLDRDTFSYKLTMHCFDFRCILGDGRSLAMLSCYLFFNPTSFSTRDAPRS
jgi:hypothetical protein